MWAMHTPYKHFDPGLVGCSRKGPLFLQKNPPAEISGYGPAYNYI